jgi:hypothetical protein
MKDDTLKIRIRAAKSLEQKLLTIQKSLDKVPSFGGKAGFMDKIINAARDAAALAKNLELDWDYRKEED